MNCGIFRLVKLRQSALLTFAGLASIATTFLFIPALRAQDQPPNLPSFEVTSVKPDTFVPGPGHGRVLELSCANGRFVSRNASVWYVIKWAWNIVGNNDALVGYPDWTKGSGYVIEARAAAPVPEEQCRLMLRSLMADRFHLRVHEESRLIDAFDLVISKSGPKIKQVTDSSAPINGPGFTISGEKIQMLDPRVKGWTMHELADALAVAQLGRKVFDRTGLEGIYRIEMRFSRPDDFGVDPDVATALREQLGLELRPAKEPLGVVVVDHIERPSQN
jgi:uncharacterized protein (TIGR03435 family)